MALEGSDTRSVNLELTYTAFGLTDIAQRRGLHFLKSAVQSLLVIHSIQVGLRARRHGSPSHAGSDKMNCNSITGETNKKHGYDFQRIGKTVRRNSRAIRALADGLFACGRGAHGAL